MSCQDSEHISLYPFSYDRTRDLARNRLLLKVHLFVGSVLFAAFSYQSVTGGYPLAGGAMAWVGFIVTWGFGSFLIFSSAIMFIPSIFLAKAIGPEIILASGTLVYLGGSNSIKDGSFALFFKPLIYLEGMEPSISLNKSDIESITIRKKKDFFTMFKFNTAGKNFIEIKHNKGSLLVGGAFVDILKPLQSLNNWHTAT